MSRPSIFLAAVQRCFRTTVGFRSTSVGLSLSRRAPAATGCGEPLPLEATGTVSGAEDQTTTHRSHPVDDDDPEPSKICGGDSCREIPFGPAMERQILPGAAALMPRHSGEVVAHRKVRPVPPGQSTDRGER
jgi:hypothetical protein